MASALSINVRTSPPPVNPSPADPLTVARLERWDRLYRRLQVLPEPTPAEIQHCERRFAHLLTAGG